MSCYFFFPVSELTLVMHKQAESSYTRLKRQLAISKKETGNLLVKNTFSPKAATYRDEGISRAELGSGAIQVQKAELKSFGLLF